MVLLKSFDPQEYLLMFIPLSRAGNKRASLLSPQSKLFPRSIVTDTSPAATLGNRVRLFSEKKEDPQLLIWSS
jgi:hypothetical protein